MSASASYRVVFYAAGEFALNQVVPDYETASLMAETALDMTGGNNPNVFVAVYGPHARRPELGEVRLWSYERKSK